MGDVDKLQEAEEFVAQMEEGKTRKKKKEQKEELQQAPLKETAQKVRVPEVVALEQIGTKSNIRFELDHIQELAISIKEKGLITPLLVRRAPDGGAKPFELVAGRRRLEALRLLSADLTSTTVRCDVLDDLNEAEVYELMFTENVQREPLKPLECARALRHLLDLNPKLTAQILAGSLGVSQSYVSRHLLMLDLPNEVQAQLESGDLSFTVAELLRRGHTRGRVSDEEVKNIAKRVVAGEVTTREVRALVAPKEKGEKAAGEESLDEASEVVWHDLTDMETPLSGVPHHSAAEIREKQLNLERQADDLLSAPLNSETKVQNPKYDFSSGLSPQAVDAYLLARVIRDLLPDDVLASRHLQRELAFSYVDGLKHQQVVDTLRELTLLLAAKDSHIPKEMRSKS